MFTAEWSLIIFTTLTQCAVGIWFYGILVNKLLGDHLQEFTSIKASWRPLLVVGPMMCIALIISLFHLGTPSQAYASIANLFSSWLSREIAFSCLFLFLWVISLVKMRREGSGQILSILTLLLGIAAIFSMSSIYFTTPLPAWTTLYTYFGFYATMLVLGAMTYIFLLSTAKGFHGGERLGKIFWRLSLLTFGVILVQVAAFSYHFHSFMVEKLLIYAILHGLFLILGGASLLISAYQGKSNKKGRSWRMLVTLGFFLLWGGEFIGRFLFYAIGVPLLG
ncbi:MAG: dimethyl sulfoxide reductase anchor subunit [Desulfitobacterium sp.]|nr:dimethyl sulfoxide reductase anchor subunit [Desulfitobacterium sp.]